MQLLDTQCCSVASDGTLGICLLGTKGGDLRRGPDKLLAQFWGQLVLVVHSDTKDVGKNTKAVLEVKHSLLGRG